MTNIVLLPLRYTTLSHKKHLLPQAAHRTPQEALLCAKAKRQQQMFYLCESEASATKRPPERKLTPLFAEEPYLIKFDNLISLI
ncbi:hypothetical protein [Lysinibacillus sp. NPDC059133]|uniref:hypothetical protein n=1 Tax=Lysinibacillus sp. NPDC059133 TaxID=3346737 RepID=UPI0036A71A34